ncbi:SDR family oxidoreductase [Mycolicibacterium sp.]|uniref:SDR family NAD(P)-dependent oxidoreductase n=1 Tax=Mycolicibacterium sp. TaxID=2320850 RepID=UPI0028B0BAD1|nr:SDR family oxidoreductase [Mycolicibacterium sp.]
MSLPEPGAGSTVVVTGASSGIGAEIARGLGRRGYRLLLVARRADRLTELAAEITAPAEAMPLDLADPDARAQLVARIGELAPAGLVNSAGFGTNGLFQALPPARESEQVTLNALALMELTHAVLPGMVARGCGAVLNVGSIAGFQPLPDAAVYSATKAFVQTFSEAVHEGLHGTGVSCTVLCPGPVPTEWWDIAGADRSAVGFAATSAAAVADAGITAMVEGKRLVVPGVAPKLMGVGGRLTPRRLLLPALRRAAEKQR